MGDEGGPVLGMLGAILGADGDAQDDRHLEDAGGHRLPLRQLVEDLIPGAAEEVGVHQLDQGAAATHRIANGGTDDRTFGDR